MKNSIKSFFRLYLKYLVSFVLLGAMVAIVSPQRFLEALRGTDWRWLAGGLLLTVPLIVLKSIRWFLLARLHAPAITWTAALRSYLGGLGLAVITPLSSGEIVRGVLLQRVGAAELTGAVVLDKLLDFSALSCYLVAGLAMLGGVTSKVFALIYLLANFLFWFNLPLVKKLYDQAAGRWPTLQKPWLNSLAAAFRLTGNRLAVASFSLALTSFFCFYLQAGVILHAYAKSFPWQAISMFPLVTLSTILPIAVGGLGVREGVGVLLLRQYGLQPEVIINTFLTHFLLVMVIPAAIGFFLLPVSTAKPDAKERPS